jgi:hypothetical protein
MKDLGGIEDFTHNTGKGELLSITVPVVNLQKRNPQSIDKNTDEILSYLPSCVGSGCNTGASNSELITINNSAIASNTNSRREPVQDFNPMNHSELVDKLQKKD